MRRAAAVLILAATSLLVAGPAGARPLRVVATLPDLASLVRAVGGEAVEVDALVRGGEDPHFVEAKPSFIRLLNRADLFVYNGLDLEIGWVPPLLARARNSDILPGGPGDFDASAGIEPLQVPTGRVDRSMGDVHPRGNPHYLLDPVNGLRVARGLRDRLSALRPEEAEGFAARAAEFERRLLVGLVGEALVERLGAERLADAAVEERLDELVRAEAAQDEVGGWLGALRPHAGRRVVADHDLWPYFERRFDVRAVGFLEPFPGIAPTTRHLAELAERMRRHDVRVILSAAYFHPRYAQKVAEATGAEVVTMANQVGARDEGDDYLTTTDWNVRRLADALGSS